jgi:tyrosyl-tRNA synthetase
MIGDPDGKKQERDLQSVEQIESNKNNIVKQYRQIFAGEDFDVVDNYDWFKNMGYLEFLREIGKKVPMSQLLDREFIKTRLGDDGQGISYAEFSYNLIQGYDFLHLYREKNATLQVAGGDQWGNAITGVQLIKKIEGADANVVTTPLIINKATGVKFGKSEDGAVWLDPAKTSPYKFYQFWLNVDDETAKDLIKIYTLLDKETVEALIADHEVSPGARALQKRLAAEVTELIHGVGRRESVERVTEVLFGGGDFSSLSDTDIIDLAQEIPVAEQGSFVEVLVSAGMAKSNGEARRLIQSGAVSVNGDKITEDRVIDHPCLVKKGKNSFVLVK